MPQITKSLTINVDKANALPQIIAKQYDANSRYINAVLISNGEPVCVEASSVVTINARREYGEAKAFLGTANDDGSVRVPISRWMLALDGKVVCDISVVDSEKRRLSTTSFTIEVEAAAYDGSDISTDDDEYNLLLELIENASNAVSQCNKATTAAEYAAQTATNAAQIAQTAASKVNTKIDELNEIIKILPTNSCETYVYAGAYLVDKGIYRIAEHSSSIDIEFSLGKATAEGEEIEYADPKIKLPKFVCFDDGNGLTCYPESAIMNLYGISFSIANAGTLTVIEIARAMGFTLEPGIGRYTTGDLRFRLSFNFSRATTSQSDIDMVMETFSKPSAMSLSWFNFNNGITGEETI